MTASERKTHYAVTQGGSPLGRYQDVIVGQRSILFLLYFEFCLWLTPLPGLLGLVLRKIFWPRLFAQCGKGTVFGQRITLRHPNRISLGSHVIIGDDVTLDARSNSKRPSLQIEDRVTLADHCILTSKDGTITIGSDVGVGTSTLIQATSGCSVAIGKDSVIGPQCYVAGGANYDASDPSQLIRTQPIRQDGGCELGQNVWLGAKVCVLDEARIGAGSIVAAGSVVISAIPPLSVCGGIPAKVIKSREG